VAKPRRSIDIGAIVALSWLMAAMGVTVFIGPMLGLRGWIWLGLHHVLCVVGSVHELRRASRRHRESMGVRDARK
jgi:hypothetical protein